jgi:hypothetical protein
VHIYVGGPAGSGAPGYDIGQTNQSRPDVTAAVPPAGPDTGFLITVPAPGGSVPIYAYGINVGAGTNSLLGSKTVTVAAGPASWPAPAATTGRLPASTTRRRITVSWHGLSGRPSPVSYDVRYRWISVKRGSTWRSWASPARWVGDGWLRGPVSITPGRRYQFSVRVHAALLGPAPSRWSTPRTITVK